MITRAVNLSLLLATLVGGYLALQSGRERIHLKAELGRLSTIAGDMPISDPSKVHILAMDTGEPLHFAWRMYFPANYPLIVSDGRGNLSSGMSSEPHEIIARVRFRELPDQLYLYTDLSGSRSQRSLGDKSLVDLLHGRWGDIRLEQFGKGRVVTLEPDEQAALVRLTIPEAMDAEKLSGWVKQGSIPMLFELKLGPDKK